MKLFISYSRDDKAWVYELWRNLRDRAHHDAWIDQRIIPAQDWWDSILTNIETAECVLYIMTPKSVDSIYCQAEMTYALALNKPILPLMLKPCNVPSEISTRRIQYFSLSDTDSLGDVLFTIERGLSQIRVDIIQGKFVPPAPPPERPVEPTRPKKPEQVSEIFQAAADAAAQNNTSLAEKLYQQVMDADPDGYGKAAAKRLGHIRQKQQRDRDLLVIIQMSEIPAQLDDARALWEVFVERYGSEGEPDDLRAKLSVSDDREASIFYPATVTQTPPPPHKPLRPRSLDLLRKGLPSFEWIAIPGKGYNIGKYPVTNDQFKLFIEANGYQDEQWWTQAGWEARAKGLEWNGKERAWVVTNDAWIEPRYWTDTKWNGAEQPVVGVSWYEAVAYCLWLSDFTGESIMLPTEVQWQYAAQGNESRDYPWGSEWDCKKCNNSVKPCDSNQTTPVRQYEGKGDSPFKVVDMAGNVWEWCLTDYEKQTNYLQSAANSRVLRGGAWDSSNSEYFRCANRVRSTPYVRNYGRGFRLALSI